jgi:CRISPR-associated endonuclease/helicase Cas3
VVSFPTLLAHLDRDRRRVETLPAHLRAVASRAEQFGAAFGAARWAFLAGLWHDLGKARPEFQQRIGSLDTPGDEHQAAEHSGLGAALAMSRSALPVAFAIAGHHCGLANLEDDGKRTMLRERVKKNKDLLERLAQHIPAEFYNAEVPPLPDFLTNAATRDKASAKRSVEFFTRFIFSCLIDADRLVSESFDAAYRAEQRAQHDVIPTLLERLERALHTKQRDAAPTPVNRVRAQIADACAHAASLPQGVFTLDVPTGGGKTLASMRFALRHAATHGLRRAFVVIPYTSIITQNAQQYREILGDRNVLEHHAALTAQDRSPDDESGSRGSISHELAAENWDKPVVVTTTVRFFESLYGASTSACRRLHNIARSVVVLDEVQTLPPAVLEPILDGLHELVRNYGVTLVLSTATQPALTFRPETDDDRGFPGLPDATPIIDPAVIDLRPLTSRVTFRWPCPATPAGDGSRVEFERWDNRRVADELARHDRALCIVNTKKDAREIASLLGDRAIHLTTALCPAHRAATLNDVRRRLAEGTPCLLIATQLVEAGVDLDFPIVYRALAGLDSVVQAAGRCNREGRLTPEQLAQGLGVTVVYQPQSDHPDPTYKAATEIARDMLAKRCSIDLNDPSVFRDFFQCLYGACSLDARKIQSHRAQLAFETVEQKFKIIDSATASVVVPYGDFAAALAAYRANPGRNTSRALQPFIVPVYRQPLGALRDAGAVEAIAEGLDDLFVLRINNGKPLYPGLYDDRLGLNPTALQGAIDVDQAIV